jgi:hypothetical protein
MEPEKTSFLTQQLVKYIPAARNTQATIEELMQRRGKYNSVTIYELLGKGLADTVVI